MTDEEKTQMKGLVNAKCAELSEHFDSVQIFVTVHSGGDEATTSYETGKGNFYARIGHIQEWICIQNQYQRNEAIRRDET